MFGSIGRSDSATDNAPLDMYDTTVMFKPRGEWRPGMTYETLISEMDARLQFPGLTNRSLSAIEPVSAPPKRKLENGAQRPAPETLPRKGRNTEKLPARDDHGD